MIPCLNDMPTDSNFYKECKKQTNKKITTFRAQFKHIQIKKNNPRELKDENKTHPATGSLYALRKEVP